MAETFFRSVHLRWLLAGAVGILGLTLFIMPAQAETPEEYGITITSPLDGYRLLAGTTWRMTWTSSGAAMTSVAISLVHEDNGQLFLTEIAADAPNTSFYDWQVADFDSTLVWLQIEGTDGVRPLAETTSGVFSVVNSEENAGDIFPGDQVVSPVTGEEELVDDVDPGDIVQPWSFETTYGIEENSDDTSTFDLVRRPFYNEATVLTYVDSYDEVEWVTDATMITLEIGQVILPQPGVALVKFAPDPKVYAVTDDHDEFTLRWISSESLAVAMYGADWKDYLLEMSPTAYPHFTLGEDVMTEMDMVVDMGIMKKQR